MTSKASLILKGSGFRILQTLVVVIIGFLMMPFLINTLGTDLYGLWIVIGSVVASFYILDLGFSQAVTRYVSKSIHENDPHQANVVINTSLLIYIALGLVVVIVTYLVALFGIESIMDNTEQVSLTQIVLIILGTSLALDFPSKAYPGIVNAYMRFDFVAKTRLCKSVIDAALIYYFLSNGHGIITMAIIMFVTGLISTSIFMWFTHQLFKELSYGKKYINKETLIDMSHFSKWVLIIDISNILRDKMDIWFIAYFLSNSILTTYYVGIRLADYAMQFLVQATGFTSPILTEYYTKKDYLRLQDSISLFIKANLVLSMITLSGFFIVGESFISLWMGPEFSAHEATICLLILASGRLAAYVSSPLQSLLMTTNQHNLSAWIALAETLLSVALCWILVPLHGITGAAAAVATPYVLGRLIILPLLMPKNLSINSASLLPKCAIFTVISLLISYTATILYPQNSALDLIGIITATVMIISSHLVAALVILSKRELELIKALLIRKKAGNH
ncbi:lipopolysaccharide biosynthesis protein [Oceanicoccus sagamiensis]|uniref:Polysaccharide biosynthesis protein C-terminal domain-containing protein n=1 Tax=Oceanicoccus sagamiensis TaxID=716816 RepID=A0A1X9NHY3_9GAMM|nr:oligosaccharide flippase family protein [Oceanicoccus sagamiensis]ARN74517.1 hypothetical protein BST96_10535 [Oceanicoccus sagamiensis]